MAYIMHTFIFNKMSIYTTIQSLDRLFNNVAEIRHNNQEVTDVYFCCYGNGKALFMHGMAMVCLIVRYSGEPFSTENHLFYNKWSSCCMYVSSTIYDVHAVTINC